MNSPELANDLLTIESSSARSRRRSRPIGEIVRKSGLLRQEQVQMALAHARESGMRFGEAAVSLKLLSSKQLVTVLSYQFGDQTVGRGSSRFSNEVLAAFPDPNPFIDSLSAVRDDLLLTWHGRVEQRSRVLAICSANRGDGRSFVAANIAVLFAKVGRRTLLIDGDMRHPRQDQLFGAQNMSGLSSVLAARHDGLSRFKTKLLPSLTLFTAGAVPPNPSELIAKPLFKNLLAECASRFEVVILDTPAASYSEAPAMAALADGCLILATQDETTHEGLHSLSSRLTRLNANVLGSLLTR